MIAEVGQIIISQLSRLDSLKGKIFPCVADFGDNEVSYPFATYKRNSVNISHNKDYSDESFSVNATITINTNNYIDGVVLAEQAIGILSHTRENGMRDCIIIDTSEDYQGWGFTQTIQIQMFFD